MEDCREIGALNREFGERRGGGSARLHCLKLGAIERIRHGKRATMPARRRVANPGAVHWVTPSTCRSTGKSVARKSPSGRKVNLAVIGTSSPSRSPVAA